MREINIGEASHRSRTFHADAGDADEMAYATLVAADGLFANSIDFAGVT